MGRGFFFLEVAGGKGKLTWLQSVTGPLNAWLLLCLEFFVFLVGCEYRSFVNMGSQ